MSYVKCDTEKCVGCLTCVVTCIDHHYAETETEAVSPRLYREKISKRTGMKCYVTWSCHHCENPLCAQACPVETFYKDEDGFVKMRSGQCIGCHACKDACPFDAIAYDSRGFAVKCDGCWERVKEGFLPACVKACPTGALRVIVSGMS